MHGEEMNGEVHDWWGVNNRKWNLLADQLVTGDDDLKSHATEIRNFKSQLDMSVVEWIISMKKGLEVCEKYPEHIMPVRYEELVSHPDKIIRQIVSFCQLKEDKALYSYAGAILKPVPSKDPVPLHPLLQGPFNSLMKKLRYTISD